MGLLERHRIDIVPSLTLQYRTQSLKRMINHQRSQQRWIESRLELCVKVDVDLFVSRAFDYIFIFRWDRAQWHLSSTDLCLTLAMDHLSTVKSIDFTHTHTHTHTRREDKRNAMNCSKTPETRRCWQFEFSPLRNICKRPIYYYYTLWLWHTIYSLGSRHIADNRQAQHKPNCNNRNI